MGGIGCCQTEKGDQIKEVHNLNIEIASTEYKQPLQ